MALITTIVGPVAISNTKDNINPNTPLNNEINIAYSVYCLMLLDIFLLAAAGSINNAFISNIPTHFIVSITITAISIPNTFSIKFTFLTNT